MVEWRVASKVDLSVDTSEMWWAALMDARKAAEWAERWVGG